MLEGTVVVRQHAAIVALALTLAASLMTTGCGGSSKNEPRRAAPAYSGGASGGSGASYAGSGAGKRTISCEQERQEAVEQGNLMAALTDCSR
jgi:hypothetical protein